MPSIGQYVIIGASLKFCHKCDLILRFFSESTSKSSKEEFAWGPLEETLHPIVVGEHPYVAKRILYFSWAETRFSFIPEYFEKPHHLKDTSTKQRKFKTQGFHKII